MKLLLVRHGHTFGPQDKVVYVGRVNDVPLVPHGIEQAHRVADALLAHEMRPPRIYCGTLSRLVETAKLLAHRLGLPTDHIVCDTRLDELDYGQWTGRTRAEVIGQFGQAAVLAWEKAARWPMGAGWSGDAQRVADDVRGFVAELARRFAGVAPIVVVSSNGRLRYFLHCVEGAFAAHAHAGRLKIGCGHVGALHLTPAAGQVACWDRAPAWGVGLAQRAWAAL